MRISLVSVCLAASTLVACAAADAPAPDRADDVVNIGPAAQKDQPKADAPAAPAAKAADGAPVVAPNAAPAKNNAAPDAPDVPAAVLPAKKIPLIAMHMQFSDGGDWLMSRTANEGAPEYHYNGIQYRIFEAPPVDAAVQPLYRCLDAQGTHYQSNDFECEGAGTFESLLGYVFINDPGNGAKEIRRCIGERGAPIVSTTRIADCDPFIVQNISLGFAFDASVAEAP